MDKWKNVCRGSAFVIIVLSLSGCANKKILIPDGFGVSVIHSESGEFGGTFTGFNWDIEDDL
jgi:hypothetical protein